MFKQVSSPHAHGPTNTSWVMQQVSLALLPGLAVLTWFYGWGNLINTLLAIVFALGFEAAIIALRKRPIAFYLSDFSAVVTAMLLALTIPPYAPWWVTLIGVFFAIPVAKHLYGGLGFNPFNPAMVGYVVLLISFPVQMVEWPAPKTMTELPGLGEALGFIFLGVHPVDGVTAATALDLVKQNNSMMLDQLWEQMPQLSSAIFVAAGIEWVNVAFLAGGLYLLWRRLYTWHAPVAMLATIFLLSSLFYDSGSSASNGSPLFHLFTGGTMLGAFFIITDPVSGCTSNRGRLIFGAGVGLLVFVIRAWGNYPDAIAFGVLLMNFAAPLIDYYTLPRVYGHDKSTNVRIHKE
ncbi:MAG: electron transport complex subunit RsxD [Pseudomonadales bacterium]